MAYAFLYTVLWGGLAVTLGLSVWAWSWHWQAGIFILLLGFSTVPLVSYTLSVALLPPALRCGRFE